MSANLFTPRTLHAGTPEHETFDDLLRRPGVRIERIVSAGHSSPPGFWYDQPHGEWVVVLKGSAGLLFENEPAPRTLYPGNFVDIPAGRRHRVEWTDRTMPTIWLAVHYGLADESTAGCC